MAGRYAIEYATEAIEDLGSLRPFDRKAVQNEITRHLSHEPAHESRSRIKRMAQPFWCEFRLRVGDFRAYYDIDDSAQSVQVLRVLKKGSGSTPLEPP